MAKYDFFLFLFLYFYFNLVQVTWSENNLRSKEKQLCNFLEIFPAFFKNYYLLGEVGSAALTRMRNNGSVPLRRDIPRLPATAELPFYNNCDY